MSDTLDRRVYAAQQTWSDADEYNMAEAVAAADEAVDYDAATAAILAAVRLRLPDSYPGQSDA